MKKLFSALMLFLLLGGLCRAEEKAVLSFHSFDGGGPEYRITLEDPTLAAFEAERRYGKPDHALLEGAGYDVIFTFTGLKPGETGMTVAVRSPAGENRDIVYTVKVDESLRVTLTEKRLPVAFSLTREGACNYEITTPGDGYRLQVNQGAAQSIGADVVEALQEIIDEFGMDGWDGFDKRAEDSGEGFSLEIAYDGGGWIRAAGQGVFPPGWAEATARIDELLEAMRPPEIGEVPGAYRWPGEDDAGGITIALAADGTFALAGPASDGGGEWAMDGALLYLLGGGDPGWYGIFIPVRDALIYVEADSIDFPAALPDGARFEKMKDEWDTGEYRAAFVRATPTLTIEAGGKVFYAVLEENPSADALVEKLNSGAISVEMHDYGDFEKVGPLPWSLPANDGEITTEPGDVILYQGDKITIYYGRNAWRFTRLAKIENVTREQLLDAFGEGGVTVTFWLEWSE